MAAEGDPELEEILDDIDVPVGDAFDEELPHAVIQQMLSDMDADAIDAITDPNHPHYPGNVRRMVTLDIIGGASKATAIEVVRPDGGKHYWMNGEILEEAEVKHVYGLTLADDIAYRGVADVRPDLGR